MLNTLISPGYYLINAHLRQISPIFHNHSPISIILSLIYQAAIYQVEKNMDKKSYNQLIIIQDMID